MANPLTKPDKEAQVQQQDVFDPIASEIAKRIGSLVAKEQKSQIIAQMVSLYKEERFSGPIAHPIHLRGYEEFFPDSADRILTMAESSLAHNHRLPKASLDADIDDIKGGRRYGFAAFSLLTFGAIVATSLNEPIIAGLFLGTGALGTIGLFVRSTIGRDEEQ